MPQEGLLLQVDGSRHDWLEGRGPTLTLIGGIDDATSLVTGATFREQEDAAGYLMALTQTADRIGLPGALYSDLHGIFVKDPNRPPTLAEQLAGKRSLTQVGRALDGAGIGWIGAHSPQAKGRVERVWGTLQDRLTSELRRRQAATIEEANEVLAAYLPRHNRRFAVPAAIEEPAWGRGRTDSTPRRSSPSTIRARSRTTRPSAGTACRWPCPAGGMAGAGPVGSSPSRTPRQQPVGEPRRILLPARAGTPRAADPPGAQPQPPVGRGARVTTTAGRTRPTVKRTHQAGVRAPLAPLSCQPTVTQSLAA